MCYTKYPKTLHLPWSEGIGRDDRVLTDISHLEGKRIVITEKMDGENTSMYRDYIHARSLEMNPHPSRDWIKQFHAQIKHNIPKGWRVCGENLFATHSIHYRNLDSYFLGFSVWTENNCTLGWEETCEYLNLLNISPVPVLFEGLFREDEIRSEGSIWLSKMDVEGYVVRLHNEFCLQDFQTAVAKYVRKGHVQTDEHWMHKSILPNKLKVGA